MTWRLDEVRLPPSSRVVGAAGVLPLGKHSGERTKLAVRSQGARRAPVLSGAASGSTVPSTIRKRALVGSLEPEGPCARATGRLRTAAATRIRSEGLHVAAAAVGVDPARLLSASIGEPVPRSVLTLLARGLLEGSMTSERRLGIGGLL
jgi:hypothetical protein